MMIKRKYMEDYYAKATIYIESTSLKNKNK